MINAILIPVIRSEIAQLHRWIRNCPCPGAIQFELFFSIDNEWNIGEERDLLRTKNNSKLKEAYNTTFVDCNIPLDQSFYEKNEDIDIDVEKFPYGKKSGPNIQFFTSLKKIMKEKPRVKNVILLEVDAYPVRDNWLTELNCRTLWFQEDTFVAGSHPVMAKTAGSIRNHINGNAIYLTNNTRFKEFLLHWEKLLLSAVKINSDLGYDVVLEWSYNLSGMTSIVKNKAFSDWNQDMNRYYRYRIIDVSEVIANLSGVIEKEFDKEILQQYMDKNKKIIIVHGRYLKNGQDIIQNYFWS